jgi:hypothetical protein
VIDIKFKDQYIFHNALIVPWHPTLRSLLCWLHELNIDIILTSTYRQGDPGVHGTNPLRGFDLRSWGLYDIQTIVEMTNDHWVYDPKRPRKKVCKYHNVGGGHHLHFQVHKNTKFIDGSRL